MSRFNPAKINIVEQLLQPKTGAEKDCEDLIHISDNFIAVIDGATSESQKLWDGKSGGRLAAEIIDKCLHDLEWGTDAFTAVKHITGIIADFYKYHEIYKEVRECPSRRIAASTCVINLTRREMWLIGDCYFMLDGLLYSNEKCEVRL